MAILGLVATSTVTGHGDEHEGPTFAVQVLKDPVEGWNILIVTDLIWAPENVSTEHTDDMDMGGMGSDEPMADMATG